MIGQDSKRRVATIMAELPDLAHFSRVRRLRSSARALDPNLTRRESIVHQRAISEYGYELWLQLKNRIPSNYNENWERNFDSQPQINCRMRNLIYDFMMCCHTRLNLCTSTLFLSYSILDRYTSRFIVRSGEYQLLALTSLWISSKYWDSKNRVATLPILLSLCCEQYSAQEFKNTEIQLLKYLDWSLCDVVTCDSIVDIQLFSQGTSEGVGLNEIKLGSIMLCELSRFDLKLSLNFPLDRIVLAAITLIKLSLKFVRVGKYENFEVILSQDPQCLEVCEQLLQIGSKNDEFPSSFRFKYLRSDLDSTKGSEIIEALTSYHMQWDLERFLTTTNFAKKLNENLCYELSHSQMEFNDKTNNKHTFASSSPTSFGSVSPTSNNSISAGSPFASPSMGSELSTIQTTPESVQSSSFIDNRQHCRHRSQTIKQILSLPPTTTQAQLPPLTPTTPSILQNKLKLGFSKHSRSSQNYGSHSKNVSFSSRPVMTANSRSELGFWKTHRKRASSEMEIDFFEDNLITKR